MARRVGKHPKRTVTNDRGEKFAVGDVVKGPGSTGEKGIIRKIDPDGKYAEVIYSSMGRTRALARRMPEAYSPGRLASEAERTRGKGYVTSERLDSLTHVGRAKRVPRLATAQAPEPWRGAEEGVFVGTRAARGVSAPKRKGSGIRVVGRLGDVNFPEYDGGLVYKTSHGYEMEWVEWDYDGEHGAVSRRDVPTSSSWKTEYWAKDLEGIASSTGEEVEDVVAALSSKDPVERAGVLYYSVRGYTSLDDSAQELSRKEILSRYARSGPRRRKAR